MRFLFMLLLLLLSTNSVATALSWVTLHESKTSTLLLDRASVTDVEKLKKAWVKIEYKTPQTNPDLVEKQFNASKLLWYFDCDARKAASVQIIQYHNDEIIYSAALEAKNAQYVEPIPETEMDFTMRDVCKKPAPTVAAPDKSKLKDQKPATDKKDAPANKDKVATAQNSADKKAASKPASAESADKSKNKPNPATNKEAPQESKQDIKKDKNTEAKKPEPADASKDKPEAKSTNSAPSSWAYSGDTGPEKWEKLSPEFALCGSGKTQSPINIDNTLRATLKPIRCIMKFPAKDMVNNGHTLQVNFKEGNMMVLENAPYQLKNIQFHSPSEHTIHGESFALEAQLVHMDSKNNVSMITVLFREGKENTGLAKLVGQLPEKQGTPIGIKQRFIPSDLLPVNPTYFRFDGSLTAPPCTENIHWVVMKTPMTASKAQIDALKQAMHAPNNRPVQDLNGRMVLE